MDAALLMVGLKRLTPGVWRFPLTSAWLIVAIIAVIGLVTAPQLRYQLFEAPATSSANTPGAISTAPGQVPPPAAVRRIKVALWGLDDVCSRRVLPPMKDRLAILRQPLRAVSAFARQYPDARFRIQGESGTTQALLVVVGAQLKDCAPTLLPSINGAGTRP